jgi:polyisoprenoid-binding protein YceI
VKYRVEAGRLTVQAHSRVHDTTTVWDKVAGDIDADADAIENARATFRVDMTAFDAGDWLKNRKLRKDFEMDAHPEATFELTSIREVVRDGAKFTATAEGILRWRGKDVPLTLAGRGTLDAQQVEASASFELDIRKLGLSAPRFLVIKMEDVVTVDVTVRGKVVA